MKRVVAVLAVGGFLISAGAGLAEEGHQGHGGGHGSHKAADESAKAAPEVSKSAVVTGEILDMACYMAHEGKGPKHQKCALDCVKNGAPVGLLTKDGTVLLLVEDHSKKKAFAPLKTLAGEIATVTGKMMERGGLKAIVVEKAEKAK